MPTYSDEVNVYNPNAIDDAIGEAATTATSVITEVGSTGIKIHPSGQSESQGSGIVDYTLIDADGMEVFDGGTSVAEFGASGARVGKQAGPRTVIQSTGVDMYGASNGSVELAHFGYASSNAESGTTNAPYYSLGERNTNISAEDAFGNTVPTGIGAYSLSEGSGCMASGYCCHAEGEFSVSSGLRGHAEGYIALATGYASHAEGYSSEAAGRASHAEGYHTTTKGHYSHAAGQRTVAGRRSQTVIGEYNTEDTSGSTYSDRGKYVFIIGNGTADDARSNALAVGWDGAIECAGDTGWTTLNSTIKYRIHHGVCYVVGLSTNVTQVATGGTVVGTLPTGARPTIDVDGAATTMGNNCGQWKVGTSGQITVWGFGSATKYWAFTASYPL